jgi:Protein of unknown function (DUF616)
MNSQNTQNSNRAKDKLTEPEVIPANCDFVCFTDGDYTSPTWKVVKTPMVGPDPVRNARRHKVLVHKLFPEYKYSIWVDGNITVRGDVHELIKKYLADVNMAVYDHAYTAGDARDCVYDEATALLKMEKQGKYKDDAGLIKNQIKKYKDDGYPKHNGLLSSMELIRRHNEPDVVACMEGWWQEIEQGSRRDQLSFNYVAWKQHFKFAVIHEDSRKNEFFLHSAHLKKDYFDSH